MAYTSGRIYSGQTTGIGSSTAVPVSTASINGSNAAPAMREVLVQSDPANTTNMKVGSATRQDVILTPGQSINLPVFSPSLIYVKMVSSTGTVNWIGRD